MIASMKARNIVKHVLLAAVCFAASAWFHQNTTDSVLIYSSFVMGLLAVASEL
jgi:hypothetical protein